MIDCNDPYDSPCVHTCEVDQVSGFCFGCARTLSEISYWTRYTPGERQEILDALPARHAKIESTA